MTREVSVEATGETVGEAKWKALRDLERAAPGIDKSTVRFQVVDEGQRGLLGVGYTPARVIASAQAEEAAAAPADASAAATHAHTLVQTVVGALGVAGTVDVRETDDEIAVTVSGADVALLIGKHGQTIDALQYVTSAALHRHGLEKTVTVDAAGYRERRRSTLEGVARRAAERAARGERVELEPMTSAERRVVHEALKEVDGVETTSEGTEPNRYVVVLPA